MTTTLGELASVFRSKNAGPFQITIDLMFDDERSYRRVVESGALNADAVASRYALQSADIRVVAYPKAKAIKVTFPRRWGECGAGSADDRDVYGAQQHAPLLDLTIP